MHHVVRGKETPVPERRGSEERRRGGSVKESLPSFTEDVKERCQKGSVLLSDEKLPGWKEGRKEGRGMCVSVLNPTTDIGLARPLPPPPSLGRWSAAVKGRDIEGRKGYDLFTPI